MQLQDFAKGGGFAKGGVCGQYARNKLRFFQYPIAMFYMNNLKQNPWIQMSLFCIKL